jgi:hypothetical protein
MTVEWANARPIVESASNERTTPLTPTRPPCQIFLKTLLWPTPPRN